MRILLAEHHERTGAAVLQTLKDNGYAVDWVTDGEMALQAESEDAYDLALLDLGLPRADGMEVLRRLRCRCRKLPVIMVAARDSVDDRVAALDLGADDYLATPSRRVSCWHVCVR